METKHLKKYAPDARREFIEAVTNKAAVYGLLPDEILPMQEEGDVVIIGDRPFPRAVAKQRKELEDRIRKEGFQQFFEAIAYTWFNRFVAIRYMELHGYLDHGYRVLSHPEGKSAPEILENAERIELPGLNRDEVVDLKLDGGKDEQLYQILLLAQCNALHKAMPFLFESIKDGTELLLPDNLLHTDSLVRKLVNDIPENQWENVEIVGWLYQFYISEKKDEVIGKVVQSEDIPAATQLFTPNWIVKYLVQNSLGRQWVTTYPESPLRRQMHFYIEPAEQSPEVQQQLPETITASINPEDLTLLDPACGSGHILVEAYDLFKAIYTERGYRARDIPALILQKNLFGLEIAERAAQLASFALLMKARGDDRRILDGRTRPHVHAIPEVAEEDANRIAESVLSMSTLDSNAVELKHILCLITRFRHASTFGSLIRIPPDSSKLLPDIAAVAESAAKYGGLFGGVDAAQLLDVCRVAQLLSRTYSHVVANPPYMGPKGQNALLKAFAKSEFPAAKSDLYAMFLDRSSEWLEHAGYKAMVTMHSWMFLSSFEEFRKHILTSTQLVCLAELDNGVMGIAFGTAAAVWRNIDSSKSVSHFCFVKEQDIDDGTPIEFPPDNPRNTNISTHEIQAIPGHAVGYWLPEPLLRMWEHPTIQSYTLSAGQNKTADNARYVRYHWEVSRSDIGPESHWRLYAKGGPFRRWYGNIVHVVDWSEDAREHYRSSNRCCIVKEHLWHSTGITWSRVSSGRPSFRVLPPTATFDMVGSTVFLKHEADMNWLLALLNSPVSELFLELLNPTVDVQIKDVRNIPVAPSIANSQLLTTKVQELVDIHKSDWDQIETSVDFTTTPLIGAREASASAALARVMDEAESVRSRTDILEHDINVAVLDAYNLKGLDCELLSDSHSHETTLRHMTRHDYVEHFVSYAIGCFLGRYSLGCDGVFYARWGNEYFDPTVHSAFAEDSDEIVPLTEPGWFESDASQRFERFVSAVWPDTSLDDNLDFIALHLRPKRGESARDTVARYLGTSFYGKHAALYKKSPIYLCFSSGKLKAFQGLVYLHRYNAATLGLMRRKYVIPLQSKMKARMEQLSNDIPKASSRAHRRSLEQEQALLVGKVAELSKFEEALHHEADKKIELQRNFSVTQNCAAIKTLLFPF